MFRRIILLLVVFISQYSFACGPTYPASFLGGDRSNIYINAVVRCELLGSKFYQEVSNHQFKESTLSTVEADLLDFEDFLKGKNLSVAESQKLILKYKQFAKDCRNGLKVSWDQNIPGIDEFILYLKGAYELKLNGESYPKSWTKLLALPKDQKQYRAIWVYYTTGNYTRSDSDRIYCYNKVRSLNIAGYHDRLGLAYISYWSAFKYTIDAFLKTESCIKAIYFYGLENTDYQYTRWQRDIINEYSLFISKLPKKELDVIAVSAIGREVLLTVVAGNEYNAIDYNYIFSLLDDGKPIKSAGLAAWTAYSMGKYELSARFVKMAVDDDILGLWIKSRLAIRNGKPKMAVLLLKKWLLVYKKLSKNLPSNPELAELSFSLGQENKVGLSFIVHGELGLVSITNHDFLKAMHLFVKGGSGIDACLVAEQCLEIDALRQYVDQYPNAHSMLSNILSNRYFRQGEYELAYRYSTLPQKKLILKFKGLLEDGSNLELSGNQRGLAYYNAAKIVRYEGMDFAGTLFAPDFAITQGHFSSIGIPDDWHKKFGFTGNLDMWKYSDKRFHYRYQASDLMYKAVELSDSRALKAMAAYCGGMFVQSRDPKFANKYYKALVKSKCGVLSDAADARRWFPITISEYVKGGPVSVPVSLEKEFKNRKSVTVDSLEILVRDLNFSCHYFEYYQKKKKL